MQWSWSPSGSSLSPQPPVDSTRKRDIRPDGFHLASPLKAAPLSAEIKPSVPGPFRGAAADWRAWEEALDEVGTGRRGSSLYAQKAKPDSWLSCEQRWKGDRRISAPWHRLRHVHAGSCSLFSSLWAAAPSATETLTSLKALCQVPKGLPGRQTAVSHGGFCLLCSLSVTPQIFAFWQVFSFAKCLLFGVKFCTLDISLSLIWNIYIFINNFLYIYKYIKILLLLLLGWGAGNTFCHSEPSPLSDIPLNICRLRLMRAGEGQRMSWEGKARSARRTRADWRRGWRKKTGWVARKENRNGWMMLLEAQVQEHKEQWKAVMLKSTRGHSCLKALEDIAVTHLRYDELRALSGLGHVKDNNQPLLLLP